MNIELLWKPLLTGIIILLAAIILNVFANIAGITTWYDLIKNITNTGLSAIKKENIFSMIFLLIIYPYILGAVAYYTLKLI